MYKGPHPDDPRLHIRGIVLGRLYDPADLTGIRAGKPNMGKIFTATSYKEAF